MKTISTLLVLSLLCTSTLSKERVSKDTQLEIRVLRMVKSQQRRRKRINRQTVGLRSKRSYIYQQRMLQGPITYDYFYYQRKYICPVRISY